MRKVLILLMLMTVAIVHAGIPQGTYLASSMYLKTLRSNAIQTTLLALPEVYHVPMTRDINLDIVTIPVLAFGSAGNAMVARLANTKARAVYNYQDKALITFGLKIPLGINRFNANQEKTAGFLATRQFGFRNANLYNTFDISASASSSIAFQDMGPGDLSMGLGVAGLFKMPFQPTEVDQSFNPGDEVSISFASEYVMMVSNRKIRTLLDLGLTLYGSDKLGDNVTTEVGSRFNWALSGDTKIKTLPLDVRFANYIKGANKADKSGLTTKDSNDLMIALRGGLPLLQNYAPYGLLRLAYYEGGNLFENNAFVTTVGGGASKRLNERMFAHGELGLDFGKYGDAGIFGISLEGGVKYVF